MDARLTNDRNRFIFKYSPDDARELATLVDNFNDWDMIATAENREPMLFLMQLSRDVLAGRGAGRIEVSRSEVGAISDLIRISVERHGKTMGFFKRVAFNTAWKLLRKRLATV
nr:hypothetical protein [uncultured Devosia sp.]